MEIQLRVIAFIRNLDNGYGPSALEALFASCIYTKPWNRTNNAGWQLNSGIQQSIFSSAQADRSIWSWEASRQHSIAMSFPTLGQIQRVDRCGGLTCQRHNVLEFFSYSLYAAADARCNLPTTPRSQSLLPSSPLPSPSRRAPEVELFHPFLRVWCYTEEGRPFVYPVFHLALIVKHGQLKLAISLYTIGLVLLHFGEYYPNRQAIIYAFCPKVYLKIWMSRMLLWKDMRDDALHFHLRSLKAVSRRARASGPVASTELYAGALLCFGLRSASCG